MTNETVSEDLNQLNEESVRKQLKEVQAMLQHNEEQATALRKLIEGFELLLGDVAR